MATTRRECVSRSHLTGGFFVFFIARRIRTEKRPPQDTCTHTPITLLSPLVFGFFLHCLLESGRAASLLRHNLRQASITREELPKRRISTCNYTPGGPNWSTASKEERLESVRLPGCLLIRLKREWGQREKLQTPGTRARIGRGQGRNSGRCDVKGEALPPGSTTRHSKCFVALDLWKPGSPSTRCSFVITRNSYEAFLQKRVRINVSMTMLKWQRQQPDPLPLLL